MQHRMHCPYLATIAIYDEIQETTSPSYTEASLVGTASCREFEAWEILSYMGRNIYFVS